jgi:hypothetical protein
LDSARALFYPFGEFLVGLNFLDGSATECGSEYATVRPESNLRESRNVQFHAAMQFEIPTSYR